MSNIALQIERSIVGGNVAVNAPVIFNTTVYSSGNITYNSATGVITFNEAGRYIVDWWVAIQSSSTITGTVFALQTSQGALLEGVSPNRTDEVVGMGIVEVVTAPVTASLINVGSAFANYPNNTALTATLMIVEDDLVPDVTSTSIIPFASGSVPTALSTLAVTGLPGTASLIGFGDNTVTAFATPLVLTGLVSEAFSMPRDGTITSIAAYYNVAADLAIPGTTITITAQLYQSTTPDESFTPIAGASVTLPALVGPLALNQSVSAVNDAISVAVTQGSRLLLVISATAAGTTLLNTLSGVISAGITIE